MTHTPRRTDVTTAAHTVHAAEGADPDAAAPVATVHALWLQGGQAMLDGRPCTFTITDTAGVVLLQLDDGDAPFPTRLDELSDVLWDLPGAPDLRIFALVGPGLTGPAYSY